DGDEIGSILQEAFPRCDVILITGGLGPTSDDVTREVIADLLGMELHLDEEIVARIKTIFQKYGRAMPESNSRQAMVPSGAQVLDNPHGTAPGLYFPAKEGSHPHLFVMPGPPRELKPMFQDLVLPQLTHLVEAASGDPAPTQQTFRIMGVGESHIAETLDQPLNDIGTLEIGYCARMGEVDLRLIGSPTEVTTGAKLIRKTFPDQLVSEAGESLEEVVVRLLNDRREWLATVESCTGGFIAHRLTSVSGSSQVFRQGYVTYANEAKTELVGVEPSLLQAHGAVSAEVARSMAEGARERSRVHHGIASTGIAGPTGGTEEKPVGTVYLALATTGQETFVKRYRFAVDRAAFKERTSRMALELLRRRMLGLRLDA
ncbi:MAG: CinA family nicotinamide mononucleotide deamidase-related protein, partial [Verrucomicrobiota bacterium]